MIAGRYRGKVLEIVGRTVPLKDAQSAELARVLKATGPAHPWPDEIATHRCGGKDSKVPLVKVQPRVVLEAAADAAMQANQHRHTMRYIRQRADLRPADVDQLD